MLLPREETGWGGRRGSSAGLGQALRALGVQNAWSVLAGSRQGSAGCAAILWQGCARWRRGMETIKELLRGFPSVLLCSMAVVCQT